MEVTVFTPTYNRAHTIERVYKSLLAQTKQNFEWIVVDDGSSDNTSLLVRRWQEDGLLNIRFIQQTNRGKFRTMLETVQKARGEWFLIADSDDEFERDSIEIFFEYISVYTERNS